MAEGSREEDTEPPDSVGSRPPALDTRLPSDSSVNAAAVRVGIGYDSHRFAPGTEMILGGCRIPSTVRLVGHSDGDAVAHALTDAILGAAGAGDIGEMFADTDERNRGRDSIEMLRAAVARVRGFGWMVSNADVTVVTEQPKIGPYRTAMRERLAVALGVDVAAISIKGKTNERMGWIGRGEGLACMAIVSLAAQPDERVVV